MYKRYSILGLLFLSFLGYSQDDPQELVPPEILFKKNQQFNFSISPNGRFFAEMVRTNNREDLVIIDIDAYKLHNRISFGLSDISDIYWISNNRLIYESVGEIYAIDIDGTNNTKLVKRLADGKRKKSYMSYASLAKRFQYNNVLNVLPEEKNEILIETFDYHGYASIKRINVFTSEEKEIVSGAFHKMNRWIVNREGKPVLGVKYDDDGWAYFVENKELGKWTALSLKIDGRHYPFQIDASSYLDQNLTLVGAGYEPGIIYVASNVTTDKRVLLKYDYVEQKIVETLAQDVNCDISDADGVDLKLVYDKRSKLLAGLRYEGILPEYKWVNDEFSEIYAQIKKKHNTHFNDVLDIDNKNERFLIKQWSDIYAGNVGVYDTRDSTYKVMFHFNEELNKFKLSKTRNIYAKNREGSPLQGYLNLPAKYDVSNPVPLITIPHGGPWVRDYWELDQFAQFFASRGYAVLRINYRGSAGFGKEHILAGVKGFNTVMIDDIVDATNFIKDSYAIDGSKVFIFGHSYGGYATYMSLIRYKNVFKAGVAVSAPTDLKEWMKVQKKDDNSFSYQFWKAALGGRDIKYLSEISPINFVDQITTPIMVFHGKHDNIIPVDQAENMKKKFLQKGKDDVFSILQNAGHGIWDSNSIGYILEETDEFFKRVP
ncbi:alpha/beta fold hydrolase [Flavobacteriaceae bacterium 3-367]|uniref:alpha/beta hydrolase family protein n=1 Tax=Eudoraea algarum TaxID=3417568 RepID=UPI00328FB104